MIKTIKTIWIVLMSISTVLGMIFTLWYGFSIGWKNLFGLYKEGIRTTKEFIEMDEGAY